MHRLIIIVSFFTASVAGAQNLNGVWKGKLVQDPGGCFPVYNIELQLQMAGTRITGSSYHYSDTSNFVKEDFEGSFNQQTGGLLINEIKVVTFHVPGDCVPCIKKYSLNFHKGDDEEQLRGSWGGVTMTNKAACPQGTIVLARTSKPDFKPEYKLPPYSNPTQ